MLEPPSTMPPFPSSPAGSNFTPRKEFVQPEQRSSSSFALLALSSNNAVRLSNFPKRLVTSLRTLLDSIVGLRSFRENSEHKLCEIILTGKPWSNPKSLSTEILLVQIFGVLFAQGYAFLSQIDYGREHNDRLSLAFSKPLQHPDPGPSILPFAVSFPSPTVLRVVCSPLHATPAILQSVRGAWPRGVTAEKKLGEGCFEFKLKGYSWFQEDTFPEDALAHILTLLTAFDKHAWSLVTSLSLTSTHPRNKDLWIFAGPDPGSAPSKDPRPSSPVQLGTPLSPTAREPIMDHSPEGSGDSGWGGSEELAAAADRAHVRGATADASSASKRLSKTPHARAATDPAEPTGVLRKKAPAPGKHASDEPMLDEPQQHADHSIIPGPPPPDVIYSTPVSHAPPSLQHTQTDTIHVSDLPMRFPAQHDESEQQRTPIGEPPSHPLVSLPEPAKQHQSEEDFREDTATLRPPPHNKDDDVSTPPLLGPTAFGTPSDEVRDSAFSDATFDVPITWVPERRPPPPPSAFLAPDARTVTDRSSITTGPLPPGGWAPTPAVEIDDPVTSSTGKDGTAMPERHNAVEPRSPDIVREGGVSAGAGAGARKSEVGEQGVVPSEDAPPVPTGGAGAGEQKQGWVLVSVESGSLPSPVPEREATPPLAPKTVDVPEAPSGTTHVPVSAAQLIAAADATATPPPASSPPAEKSALGRLFSRSRPRKDGGVQKVRSADKDAEREGEREKGGRFRRRTAGGVMSTFRSGKRVSID